jgi:hypothetical protein
MRRRPFMSSLRAPDALHFASKGSTSGPGSCGVLLSGDPTVVSNPPCMAPASTVHTHNGSSCTLCRGQFAGYDRTPLCTRQRTALLDSLSRTRLSDGKEDGRALRTGTRRPDGRPSGPRPSSLSAELCPTGTIRRQSGCLTVETERAVGDSNGAGWLCAIVVDCSVRRGGAELLWHRPQLRQWALRLRGLGIRRSEVGDPAREPGGPPASGQRDLGAARGSLPLSILLVSSIVSLVAA